MADTRTDADANAQDNDGAALFTAQTPTPRIANNNFISAADEELSRTLMASVGFAYRDMRAKWWSVKWSGKTWVAYPLKATAAAYNAEFGTQMDPKRMYAAANNAPDMIAAIDERLEAARANAPSGIPWWLVALGLYAWSKRGRR